MCHLSIAVDQSVHPIAPILELVEASCFYIRSIRVAPVAWSNKADLYLSLGGGSDHDLKKLIGKVRVLPAVLATHHSVPPLWISPKLPAQEG